MVRLFHLLNRGNQVLLIIINSLKRISQKSRMLLSSVEMIEASLTKSLDPDQTVPVGAI